MNKLTKTEFYSILNQCAAIQLDDTVGFVGHDTEDGLYFQNDADDIRFSFDEIDDGIDVDEKGIITFYIDGELFEVRVLEYQHDLKGYL